MKCDRKLDKFIADAQRAHKSVARIEKQVARLRSQLAASRKATICEIKRGVLSAQEAGIIDRYATPWEVASHIAREMRGRFDGDLNDDIGPSAGRCCKGDNATPVKP